MITGITLLEHRKDGDGFVGSFGPQPVGPQPARRAVSKMPNGSSSTANKISQLPQPNPGDGLFGRVPAGIDWCHKRAISLSALHKYHFQHHCDLFTPDGEGIRAEPPPALTWQSAHSHLASQRRITRWAVSITACHGRWRAPPGPWFTTGAYLKPAEASRLSLRAYAPRFRR